jgi:hypothetical protein
MAKDLANLAFKELATKGAKQALGSVNPLDALNNIVDLVSKLQETKEREKTNRHAISARRDVIVESIRAERDAFIQALEMNYRERTFVYTGLFKTLDDALESGNVEIASLAMGGILEQIKNNPLPSFNDFKTSFFSNQSLDF